MDSSLLVALISGGMAIVAAIISIIPALLQWQRDRAGARAQTQPPRAPQAAVKAREEAQPPPPLPHLQRTGLARWWRPSVALLGLLVGAVDWGLYAAQLLAAGTLFIIVALNHALSRRVARALAFFAAGLMWAYNFLELTLLNSYAIDAVALGLGALAFIWAVVDSIRRRGM